MRWGIPELIRNMRDEAKFLTSNAETKEINGDLINAVAIMNVHADYLEEIWKNRNDLLIDLLDDYKHKVYCDCLDCENHRGV